MYKLAIKATGTWAPTSANAPGLAPTNAVYGFTNETTTPAED